MMLNNKKGGGAYPLSVDHLSPLSLSDKIVNLYVIPPYLLHSRWNHNQPELNGYW